MTYNVLNENPQSKINAIVNGPKPVTPEAVDRETSKPMPIGPQDVNVQVPSEAESAGKPSQAPDSVKGENKKGFLAAQKQAIQNGARGYLERKVKEKQGITHTGPDNSLPQPGSDPLSGRPEVKNNLPQYTPPQPNTPGPKPLPALPKLQLPKFTKPNFKR